MAEKRSEQILDYAEEQMRKGGYDAVSFRDIATAVGIKSASVHYHYPTKTDLSRAVTNRYAERFLEGLGDPAEGTPKDRLGRLTAAYKAAFEQDTSVCLCAILGSVSGYLPPETSEEVRAFFTRLMAWGEAALTELNPVLQPALVVSTLQGSMILALASGKADALDNAIAFIETIASAHETPGFVRSFP